MHKIQKSSAALQLQAQSVSTVQVDFNLSGTLFRKDSGQISLYYFIQQIWSELIGWSAVGVRSNSECRDADCADTRRSRRLWRDSLGRVCRHRHSLRLRSPSVLQPRSQRQNLRQWKSPHRCVDTKYTLLLCYEGYELTVVGDLSCFDNPISSSRRLIWLAYSYIYDCKNLTSNTISRLLAAWGV